MTISDCASAELLESWVLAGYQRLERLNVPAFAEKRVEMRRQRAHAEQAMIRSLPTTGLPREICDMQSWLSGVTADGLDPLIRLSLFFRYLACPLRYEPQSESAIHKAVPSSRGRFPLKYVLLQPSGGAMVAHAYVPEFHALRELDIRMDADSPNDEAVLVCIGRAWRYAEEYGEFSHVPCVLEAGHAFSQARHLASLLRIANLEDPGRELGRGLCEASFEVPLYCIGLRPGMDVAALKAVPACLSVPRPYPEVAARFPRLERFQDGFDSGPSSLQRLPGTVAAAREDGNHRAFVVDGVLELMRRRTSGNDRGRVTSVVSQVSEGTCESIADTFTRIRALRPATEAEREIRLSVIWLASESGRPRGVYDIDDTSLSAREWAGDLNEAVARMLPYADTRYNFSALTAIYVIQTEYLSAMRSLGQGVLRDMHIAAGAAAHDLSLAVTAYGMYGRPMKMMREARLESEFPLRGQVIYLVFAGYARSPNPTMELL